jgi:hypothetical protein
MVPRVESNRIVRMDKLVDVESVPHISSSAAVSVVVTSVSAGRFSLRDGSLRHRTIKCSSPCDFHIDKTSEVSLADLADYYWLVGDEAERWLLEFADSSDAPHVMQGRLRKHLSSERARLVTQQLLLRMKAEKKFGDLAHKMFFTDLGLQQSTDRWIAAYKAERFIERNEALDFCCGIGGDLMALANHAKTTGWDRDPIIVLFAESNLRAANLSGTSSVSIGSVEEHPPVANSQWHLDPDRRTDGRRSTYIEWHSPDEATIRSWLASSPNAAIKLAPATRLSSDWQQMAELEWISRSGECRQLVAWFGELSQSLGSRRATIVTNDSSYSFAGSAEIIAPIANHISDYVFDTDPAIRAAGLTGALASEFGASALSEGAAYLTSDVFFSHPLLSAFRVEGVSENWPNISNPKIWASLRSRSAAFQSSQKNCEKS